jgi:protease II
MINNPEMGAWRLGLGPSVQTKEWGSGQDSEVSAYMKLYTPYRYTLKWLSA